MKAVAPYTPMKLPPSPIQPSIHVSIQNERKPPAPPPPHFLLNKIKIVASWLMTSDDCTFTPIFGQALGKTDGHRNTPFGDLKDTSVQSGICSCSVFFKYPCNF